MSDYNNVLIGHTGFVGSNLARQWVASESFNSKNFREMIGRSFGTVVCAGTSAVKWKANQNPEDDWRDIQALIEVLKNVRAKSFVLLSTIDIYPPLQGLDESYECGLEHNHAYGRHRLALEVFCQASFDTTIVRLPGLFGTGLKKNIIYDLLNDNCLESINPSSTFQFYHLADLWSDIEKSRNAGLSTINLFPEPLLVSDIIKEVFPGKSVGEKAAPEAHYNLKTQHSDLFGGPPGYIAKKSSILHKIKEFVSEELRTRL